MKLRMEIVNSDNVVDYELQNDYSFNSYNKNILISISTSAPNAVNTN